MKKKFEYYYSPGHHFRCMVTSKDDDYLPHLDLGILGHTVTIYIPSWVLKPKKVWIDTSQYHWSKNPAGGYWDAERRSYGVYLWNNHFNVNYGIQTDDSSTEQRWSCFLPFADRRYSRSILFNDKGEMFSNTKHSYWAFRNSITRKFYQKSLNQHRSFIEDVPKVKFWFKDYDGQPTIATTYMIERQWEFGTGKWFSWLSAFVPTSKSRSLDLEFDKGIGPRKESGKGGTTGHSCKVVGNELHYDAFMRYAEEHNLTDVRIL